MNLSGFSPLLMAILTLASLTLVGTLGFMWIEDASLVDAIFMAVITLSTVGFGEIVPLSSAGRLFTTGLIILGIGTALYTVGALSGFILEGRFQELIGRKTVTRSIAALSNHVIVCGYGRLGRTVADRLADSGTPFVVIDIRPELQAACDTEGTLFVCGSALDDTVLTNAGIERARALVAATGNDPDNVFIALSAREANPGIQIHARAESEAGGRHLALSGAQQVVSPHQIAGRRIANAIVRPGVVEFLELSDPGDSAEVDLEEIELAGDCALADLSLRELPGRDLHVTIVAIKRGDEPLRLHPLADEVLRPGDRVVVVGDREQLAKLAELATRCDS